LANVPTTTPVEVSWVGNTFPGQIWTADDQCKMIYGSGASFCPVLLQYFFILSYFSILIK